MKLYINTTDNQKTIVSLNNQTIEKVTGADKSQQVLGLINQIIEENHWKISDITEIKVETGPGSFTGLKVGIAIANTLGWLLNVPVNGEKFAIPKYEEKESENK